MGIYSEKVSELFGLSGNEIVQRMEEFCSNNSEAEKKSWRASLPRLISVLQAADLGNLYLITEYELLAGGRIDATLIGDDEKGNQSKFFSMEIMLQQNWIWRSLIRLRNLLTTFRYGMT